MTMFARRVSSLAASTPRATQHLALRSFSVSTTHSQRAPALADVPPDSSIQFKQRQQDFRDEQIRRKKERELQESQSASKAKQTSPSQSPHSHHSSYAGDSKIAGISTVSHDGQGLGSYSTSGAGKSQSDSASASSADGSKKKSSGTLSSLIYGTEEGREMDREIERSFSQVLARGKYVHSIVFHEVKPDKVDEYVELVGSWYPRMANMPENKVHLVGSWRTEVGDCDTFVHIWEYQRYTGYHASLNAIQHHPDFPAFDKKLKSLIHSKRTSLMQEFSFWPTTAPRQLGGIFELRSYTLHPGNLLEWEHHWRKGLEARKEVMEGVGAWFVQIGALNVVHHLWQFADLEERRATREQSWSISGWAETVHKTVPLIQTMDSRIMVPLPWSPVA